TRPSAARRATRHASAARSSCAPSRLGLCHLAVLTPPWSRHLLGLPVDVLPDIRRLGERLIAHRAGLGGDLLGPPGADRVHLLATHHPVRLQLRLEGGDAVLLGGDEVGARGAGGAVEAAGVGPRGGPPAPRWAVSAGP